MGIFAGSFFCPTQGIEIFFKGHKIRVCEERELVREAVCQSLLCSRLGKKLRKVIQFLCITVYHFNKLIINTTHWKLLTYHSLFNICVSSFNSQNNATPLCRQSDLWHTVYATFSRSLCSKWRGMISFIKSDLTQNF